MILTHQILRRQTPLGACGRWGEEESDTQKDAWEKVENTNLTASSIEASEGATESVVGLLTISAIQKGGQKLKTQTNAGWKRTCFWRSMAWVQVGNWTEKSRKGWRRCGCTQRAMLVFVEPFNTIQELQDTKNAREMPQTRMLERLTGWNILKTF